MFRCSTCSRCSGKWQQLCTKISRIILSGETCGNCFWCFVLLISGPDGGDHHSVGARCSCFRLCFASLCLEHRQQVPLPPASRSPVRSSACFPALPYTCLCFSLPGVCSIMLFLAPLPIACDTTREGHASASSLGGWS